MNLITRKRHRGLAALAAATFAMVGVSQVSASAATKITLTEEDYFNTPGQVSALALYNKQFEAAHPGVTVKRQYVPFQNLDTKLLTQAAGHDLPNLLAVDNPFVSTMVTTGQVVPLSGFMGFSTKGYFPAIIDEGLSNGKYYSLPVAGANSIALMYNIAMLKAANITPPKTWAQLVTDAKALTTSQHYGIALTCDPSEDTTWQWEPFFWSNGGAFNFSNVASAPGVQALSLWSQLVTSRFGVEGLPQLDPNPLGVGAVRGREGGHDGQRPLELLGPRPGAHVLWQAIRDRPCPDARGRATRHSAAGR